jgi:hypothetical protein
VLQLQCWEIHDLWPAMEQAFEPFLLTLAHGQPYVQRHRRYRRAGHGHGAAGQHDAEDAGVRLGCGCGCAATARMRWQRERAPPTTLASSHTCTLPAFAPTGSAIGQCSLLMFHMASLCSNKIGDAGVRDLGAALQVNTTLTTLE